MQVTVTFRHTDSTPALKAYAEEKIKKVEKFLQSPQEAHVVLSVEKIRHIAEVSIIADGLSITGKEATGDLYSAIDMVMDKIENQLKRQKSRRRTRKSGDSIRTRETKRKMAEILPMEEIEEKKTPQTGIPRVIRSDIFLPKPMTIEDAALELMNPARRRDGVVVFRNAATMNICVLHRMKNGYIGIVEAPEKE
jgi:putative sigma-54 modulation protein